MFNWLIFQRSLQVRTDPWRSPKEGPLRIAEARFLQAWCSSYHPTNSVWAVKQYARLNVEHEHLNKTFVLLMLCCTCHNKVHHTDLKLCIVCKTLINHESVIVNAHTALLHSALAAVQCIVIGPVCGFVCLWVCYHDNSKLRSSIFTKLGFYVKVVTISSWLNFGRPAPPGRGLRRGEHFWLRLAKAARSVCVSLSAFSLLLCDITISGMADKSNWEGKQGLGIKVHTVRVQVQSLDGAWRQSPASWRMYFRNMDCSRGQWCDPFCHGSHHIARGWNLTEMRSPYLFCHQICIHFFLILA